jgi:general secretion pathway protein I
MDTRKLKDNKKIRAIAHAVNPLPFDYSGFTLIEVIIATAILGISLVMILQNFSGSLKAGRSSCDYTRAIVHAKDKMEEMSQEPLQGSGEFDDGFSWASDVQPYDESEESIKLMRIKVIVSWSDGTEKARSVSLVSLKTVADEDTL